MRDTALEAFLDAYRESYDARSAAIHAGIPTRDVPDILATRAVQTLIQAKRRLDDRKAWLAAQVRETRIEECRGKLWNIAEDRELDPKVALVQIAAMDKILRTYGAYTNRVDIRTDRSIEAPAHRGLSDEDVVAIKHRVAGIPLEQLRPCKGTPNASYDS
jgi:hypothetical protein